MMKGILNNERLMNFLYIVGLGLVIGSSLVSLQYYYNNQMRECLSDPLVYASIMYEENYGYPFSGSATFTIDGGGSPILFFDSEGISAEQLGGQGEIDLTNFTWIQE